jgi:hypothetical protein
VNPSSVRDLLARVEGGITSQILADSIKDYKINLQSILAEYISSGYPSLAISDDSSSAASSSTFTGTKETKAKLLHRGAARDFNMQCFKKTSMPPSLVQTNFLSMKTANAEYNCIEDILWWTHSEGADPKRWAEYVKPPCYALLQEDLAPINSDKNSIPVYEFIRKLTVPAAANGVKGVILSESLAPLFRSIQLHDFIARDVVSSSQDDDAATTTTQQSTSIRGNKILAAELWVPDAPDDIKNPDTSNKKISSRYNTATSVLDPREGIKDFNAKVKPGQYQCITEQQVVDTNRFFKCPPDAAKDQPLTVENCNTMFQQMKFAIESYAKRMKPPTYAEYGTRYPPASTGKKCVWDCGYTEDGGTYSKDPVHVGLNVDELKDMMKMANDSKTSCERLANLPKSGGMCFLDAAKNISNSVPITKEDLEGTFEQEVCGDIYKDPTRDGKTAFANIEGAVKTQLYDVGEALENIFPNPESVQSDNVKFCTRYCTPNPAYKCTRVQVSSTGNQFVDKVRKGLSFNDIKVQNQTKSFFCILHLAVIQQVQNQTKSLCRKIDLRRFEKQLIAPHAIK